MAAHDFRTFHQLDAPKTNTLDGVFMVVATLLVVAGLPLAVGAVIHFVIPLLGRGWGH